MFTIPPEPLDFAKIANAASGSLCVENLSEPAQDPEAGLNGITNLKVRKAAEDLLADWERQGFLEQANVDRLALRRNFTPQEVVELNGYLTAYSLVAGEEPDDDELRECARESEIDSKATNSDTETVGFVGKGLSHPLLTLEEEIELGRAIRLAEAAKTSLQTQGSENKEMSALLARGERARERLILANLRLVVYVASPFRYYTSLPLDDLVQEGTIGLMRAVDRYDPMRGARFSTYATWWIRRFVTRAIANTGRAIRLPVNRIQDVVALRRLKRVLLQELGREADVDELAHGLNWPTDKVAYIESLEESECLSLDAPFQDGSSDLRSVLPAEALSPEEQCILNDRKHLAETLMDGLTAQQRDVLRRRFGLTPSGNCETLEQIGSNYGVTRERIRQIETKALRRLMPLATRWRLKGFKE